MRIGIPSRLYGFVTKSFRNLHYVKAHIYKKTRMAMTKIVPNFPIIHFYTSTDLPDGIFGAISNESRIGRNTFNEEKASFVYIPNSELE